MRWPCLERERDGERGRGQQRRRVTPSAPLELPTVGDGNASEEGGAPRGRKRAGRTEKSEAAPDTDASANAVVHDGNPKGAITTCDHTNCPLYSKRLCKQCYMVSSLFYEAPA